MMTTDELIKALRERGFYVIKARPAVVDFAHAMEARLAANDHKGGWKEDSPAQLHARLVEEIAELEGEHSVRSERWNPRRILAEAADVANFAMMIADVCGGLDVPNDER